MTMTQQNTLRSLLLKPPIVVAPGIYDPLTALIATQAGFRSLYISRSGHRLYAARQSGYRAGQHH